MAPPAHLIAGRLAKPFIEDYLSYEIVHGGFERIRTGDWHLVDRC
jgi:hypothetical protein